MRKNFGSKPWLYPQPVLIISTYNEDGTADAMNAAWGGMYDSDKVMLCLSAGHKTTANIKNPPPTKIRKSCKNPGSTPPKANWWTRP